MPFLSGRRTLGSDRTATARSCVLDRPIHRRVFMRPTARFIERTRHVTSTVHDPVELFRDVLEEQFERHTGQLGELIMCAQQPDRGGYDEETLIALTVASRRALADTAAALRRMAEGTYGTCKRCAGQHSPRTAADRAADAVLRAVSAGADRLNDQPHPLCPAEAGTECARRRRKEKDMTTSPTAAIVVGVDGSLQSMHAVDWATREAVARRCPLRIVHAFLWPLLNVPLGRPRQRRRRTRPGRRSRPGRSRWLAAVRPRRRLRLLARRAPRSERRSAPRASAA